MATYTPPPGQHQQYTPQGLARRRIHPGSAARLSTSFSLNPLDTSAPLSDVSVLASPTKGRRAAFLASAEQGHMGMGQVSPRMRSPFLRGTAASAGNGVGGPSVPRGTPGSESRAALTAARRSRSRLGLAGDHNAAVDMDATDDLLDNDDEETEQDEWKMIDSMRVWRHDANLQQLHDTAIFWGDKILSLTRDANDAFWVAQSYFLLGNYERAVRLLTDPLPRPRRQANGKGKAAATTIDDDMDDSEDDNDSFVNRPLASNIACRYLLAQCLLEQEKFEEALDVVGKNNPFREENGVYQPSLDGGLKFHSSLCYIRGLLHLRLNTMALAKESFMEALMLDVKHYEAFQKLITSQMMTPEEEWEFVNNLAYRQQLPQEAADFVRLMYVSQLRKGKHISEIAAARRKLVETHADLADNGDVLVARADELFAQYKWEDCYVITSSVLQRTPGHPRALPLHLACMYHIPRLHSSLFILAHDLVDQEPHRVTTWYAVGLWYFAGKRWGLARTYFSKCGLIDMHFAPAWITFAHSLAWEGEHDQAITAYSTAQRLFPGTHLTYLFIGQEYLQLSQSALAEEHFLAAAALNNSDPLLLNELGVAAYNRDDMAAAVDYFERAIAGAGTMQGSSATWSSTHCNLGHALRVQRRYPEARAAYAQAIRLDPLNNTAVASQAMLSQLEGDIRTAIRLYHAALAISPQDAIMSVLLNMALEEQVDTLDPTTLPGLPAAIARGDLDPFAVPKGNAAFGPLPVEEDPLTLAEAGDSSLTRDMTIERVEDYSRGLGATMTSEHTHSRISSIQRSSYMESRFNESSAMEIEED